MSDLRLVHSQEQLPTIRLVTPAGQLRLVHSSTPLPAPRSERELEYARRWLEAHRRDPEAQTDLLRELGIWPPRPDHD